MRRAVALVAFGALILVGVVLVGDRDPGSRQDAPPGSTEASVRPTVPIDLDGSRLLNTTIETRDGEATTIAAAADARPVLINFWAEWCAPCIAEMPLLEQAREENPGIRFVGINEMDPPEQAEAMADRTGITYEWFLDPDGSFAAASRTINLPTTIYLRPDGTVGATRVGAFTSAKDLARWLERASSS